jgi:predicted secreted hydrolase
VNRLRRRLLLAAAIGPPARAATDTFDYPPVEPHRLEFPRDFGAHSSYRTEWWYLTGHLDAARGSRQGELGIQLTFFRTRPPVDADNPSRFAAHQVLLAHAAIADARRGALLHEERLARVGFGIAAVSAVDTEIEIDRWRLARDPASGLYRGRAQGTQFTLELTATPTQALLLQGDRGFSRKGPSDSAGAAASIYYSEPQLALQANVSVDGSDQSRSGRGWLDHEWTSALLPPHAAGWDWVGFNLDDGSVLTAFRIRRASDNSSDLAWFAYASLRAPGRPVQTFAPPQVRFEPLQNWSGSWSDRVGSRRGR